MCLGDDIQCIGLIQNSFWFGSAMSVEPWFAQNSIIKICLQLHQQMNFCCIGSLSDNQSTWQKQILFLANVIFSKNIKNYDFSTILENQHSKLYARVIFEQN